MNFSYYNEWDKATAAWLRELISAGLLPPGDVDDRSITEVKPDDLHGYTQCHFFAGIGGWPLALQLARWPADRPVWTGSCPCQPYSTAGKQLGDADERNLWPAFFNLIRECRPIAVFGEQVASAIGHGWLDGVSADLEGEGYACGAVVLGAHSVGAPHIRQRLYWVADSIGAGLEGYPGYVDNGNESGWLDTHAAGSAAARGGDCRLSDTNVPGQYERSPGGQQPIRDEDERRNLWGDNWIACADGKARRIESGLEPLAHRVPARMVRLRGYGNAIVPQVAAEFIKAFMELQA